MSKRQPQTHHPDPGGRVNRTPADLTSWAGDATERGTDPETVGEAILDAFEEAILAHPRSAQKEIGPSEIGHPCSRWLAYRLADVAPTGLEKPPWRQAVGTAVHSASEDWLQGWNANHGQRYLTDILVEVGELYPGRPITGHLDILDVPTATIIDLKVPGPSAMKSNRAGTPESPQYRIQTHLYGRGACRAGYPVDTVAVLRVPSAGELADAVFKHEPYDETIAVNALERAGAIAQLVNAAGPAAAAALPTTDHYCHRCTWFSPGSTDLTRGCPGDSGRIAMTRPDPLNQLIA